jgi:hypothetical protein
MEPNNQKPTHQSQVSSPCPVQSYISFVINADIEQPPQEPSAVLESLSRLHDATSELIKSLQQVLEAISQLEKTVIHM